MPAAAKLPAAVKVYRELLLKLSWRTLDGAENHLQYVPPVSLSPALQAPVQFRISLATRFQAIEERLHERVRTAAALLPLSRRQSAAAAQAPPLPASPPSPAPPAAPAVPRHSYGDPESSLIEELMRPAVLGALGTASRVFMRGLNTVEVTGADRLAQAVLSRPEGQGLLTVCNHVSALDDPLVLAAAVPAETLLHPDKMRWTMCAAERCFHKKLLGSMLKSAKVLPIERGAGLDQPGVLAAERRLARGDWVHIFPEGTRAADPGRLGIVRRGVGRLYVEAAERARGEPSGSGRAPLLLPFVHKGMERINTRGKAGLGVGNDVSVLVGEPIDIEQLLQTMESRGATREELYEAVADEVAHALLVLHGNLFGYDPEPAYRRHRAAAEASGAVGRALFSAAAAAGTWGAAAETFPHERRVSGFAASASNAAWRGQQQLLQQRGAIGGAPSALMQTSEDGERGAGAPPAGGFFAPPQDDLWWLAKAQALQRVGRGVAPPPPFAAASILSAAADARC